ncbi:MAG TPA: hypothetical protein VN925_04870 [Steroidobacteraceae bacterium]|nr:hypothetical protein [Steroidobacteraceae bacterium]
MASSSCCNARALRRYSIEGGGCLGVFAMIAHDRRAVLASMVASAFRQSSDLPGVTDGSSPSAASEAGAGRQPAGWQHAGGAHRRWRRERFADDVAIVARALAERIGHWCIFNEPKTFTGVDYWQRRQAPGRTQSLPFRRARQPVKLAQGSTFRLLKCANRVV